MKTIIWKIIRWGFALFFASSIFAVVILRFVPVYFTPLMFIRCFQQVGNGESMTLHHHWIPLEEISPHLPVAVMASEDQRFLLHHGFDYNAIQKAAKQNLKSGKQKWGQAPLASKQQRTCSFGPVALGREKVLKSILRHS